MSKKIILPLLTLVVIIRFYFYFGTFGTFQFYDQVNYYKFLMQSFVAGHLYMPQVPSPDLLKLADPYDPKQNAQYVLPDASLYKGRYYLYFGPLPVIFFYLPYKYILRLDPSQPMCIIFFLSIGLIVQMLILARIKSKYFPDISDYQLAFAGLLAGLANFSLFLLARPNFYEEAISSAYCFLSLALFFLYNFLNHGLKKKYIALFSLCLALTVAGRPHFSAVCVVMALGIALYLLKRVPREQFIGLLTWLLVPMLGIGFLIGLYNYLRFDSFFEFGQKYALGGYVNIHSSGFISAAKILTVNLPTNLFLNFCQPYTASHAFPFFTATWTNASIPLPAGYWFMESLTGLLYASPFVGLVVMLPVLLWFYYHKQTGEQKKQTSPLLWFVFFVCLAAVAIALLVCSLPTSTMRYVFDFSSLFVMLAVLSLWFLLTSGVNPAFIRIVNCVFIVLGIFSIVVGLFLGFIGYRYLFQTYNPAEFQHLSVFFNYFSSIF